MSKNAILFCETLNLFPVNCARTYLFFLKSDLEAPFTTLFCDPSLVVMYLRAVIKGC